MEKVEIKVLNNVKEDAKRNYQLFKWVLVEEKNKKEHLFSLICAFIKDTI